MGNEKHIELFLYRDILLNTYRIHNSILEEDKIYTLIKIILVMLYMRILLIHNLILLKTFSVHFQVSKQVLVSIADRD